MAGNAVLVNFSSGETSPRSRGRFDAQWYQTSARKLLNWIAELTGAARYRTGFSHVRFTRYGQVGRLVTFQVNASLVYELELTPGMMRVYKNDELLTTGGPQAVSAITRSAGAPVATVPTLATDGTSNGSYLVALDPLVDTGMPGLSNLQVVLNLKTVGTHDYSMTPDWVEPGNGVIDTTDLGTYGGSGVSVSRIVEIAIPYSANDLPNVQVASSDGTMYLVCPGYAAMKLTVGNSDNFTFGPAILSNSPFLISANNITISTVAFDGTSGKWYLRASAGTPDTTRPCFITGVGGIANINNEYWNLTAGTVGGVASWFLSATYPTITGTLSGTYTSGGTGSPLQETPVAVAFYEGRLGYFGTTLRTDCFFLSRSPDPNTGNSRYDDFTGGSNSDNACFFQIASVTGDAAVICWAQGSPDYLFIGTFGGPVRASGSGLDIPITPSSINVRQFDSAGCEETMAAGCAQIFFVQRAGVTLRSIKVINPYLATFESADLCLNAEQVGYSAIQRVVLQRGRPDSLWVYRADGSFCNMSVHLTAAQAETITGWARHQLGGGDKVVDLIVSKRSSTMDKIMVMAQRSIQVDNGAGGVETATACAVEIMADDVYFPDLEDVFTGNAAADLTTFENILYRMSERYNHLDASAAYDGSVRGSTAGATLEPGTGFGTLQASVAFLASANVFKASDVGNEIWKKPDPITGVGGGRAIITAYTSPTQVTATILAPFDSNTAIAAGAWHIAVSTVYGLWNLVGQKVAVVTDGAVYSDGGLTGDASYPVVTVSSTGSISLVDGQGNPLCAAVIRVGLPYLGLLESHNLEVGGRSGPAQDKPRSVKELFLRFMNTLGVEYGTDPYDLDHVEDRLADANFDRVAPVFSGIRRCPYEDVTSGAGNDSTNEKKVVVMQRLPLPAVLQFIDVRYDTTDE